MPTAPLFTTRHPPDRRRYLLAGAVLVCGIAASLGLFSIAERSEENRFKTEFKLRSGERIRLITNSIEDNIEALLSVVALYGSSGSVSRSEFTSFTAPILARHPDIPAIAWIPKLTVTEVIALQQDTTSTGDPNFCLTDIHKLTSLRVSALERAAYFPILYIEPIEENRKLVGFDVSSDPARRDALERARDTGLVAATGRIHLVGAHGTTYGCRLFAPVYRLDGPRGTTAERRENLLGFVSFAFQIGEMVEATLANLHRAGIDVCLYDESAPEPERLLYYWQSMSGEEADTGTIKMKKTFDVGGRKWSIVCYPGPAFIRLYRSSQPLIILVSGILMTILLTSYIHTLTGHSARIDRLVRERTEALSTTNFNLEAQIATRKNAEETLRKANDEWRLTFNSITDYIFIQDTDFVILKANKSFADLFGIDGKEIEGRKCHDLCHKSDTPWVTCPFMKTKMDGKPHTEEVNDPHIGKELLVTTSPIFDPSGKLLGSVHLAKDITEIKKAERKLKEAVEMKIRFTSVVSHELRTPLTAIKEGIGLVADGSLGPLTSDQSEFLTIATRNVDRLARLINDVLDFQKLEAGKMDFVFSPNDLNKLITETAETFVPLASKKGLEISLELEESLPPIVFDRDRISQALANLINNAIKFTETGGITISTSQKEGAAFVSVADTGPGIRPEDLPRLFTSFEQVGAKDERKTGGTGLGLAISKEIVKRHHGTMWADSTFGSGTTFSFTLPISGQTP